jgi:histidinol-phosphate aminotransferase
MFDLNKILRNNIRELVPYSSARSEYTGSEGVFLDANENPYGEGLNRYPDPVQKKLRERISQIKGIPEQQIFLGNGSDEAIDLLYRAVCRPGLDEVIVCPPTYGMYEVAARLNDIRVVKVPLTAENFQLDEVGIKEAISTHTRMIFICCPNNPTGNGVKWSSIKMLLEMFNGLIVIDEAYIDFASYRSLLPEIAHFSNLVVLQTLSKAWGLANLRVGMAFASRELTAVLQKIKAPYNMSGISQQFALEALGNAEVLKELAQELVAARIAMAANLEQLAIVLRVYPSEANFLLVKFKDAQAVFLWLRKNRIIVRDRSKEIYCGGCIRISIGTPAENEQLLNSLRSFEKNTLK